MSRVDELLAQYIEEHTRDPAADPRPYVDQLRATPERTQLAALIDAYLQRAPRREWDESAFADAPSSRAVASSLAQSIGGESGLWPSLLPRLRNRARIKRGDLVSELAARLGAQSQREKVARYYNRMEQGLLPAEGVSDSVLAALGGILGQSADALRQAGRAIVPPEQEAPGVVAEIAFARLARAADEPAVAELAPSEHEDWDEVDRLFTGGP
jgi:hypothetical protein